MKKNKLKVIISALGYLVLLFILLIVYSLRWLETKWGDNVSIETIIYQLDAPLKGTPSNLIEAYLFSCIIPSLIIVFAIFFLKVLSSKKHVAMKYTIRFRDSVRIFYINANKIRVAKIIVILLSLCISVTYIYSQCSRLRVGKYLHSLYNASTIFEEKYVDPTQVSINFSDKKHNLILIYLESMESTYTSRDNGGGKEHDYIKELCDLASNNVSFSNTDKLGGPWNCFGTGWTMAALLASTSGVPFKLPIEGNSAGKYEQFLPGIATLGDVLERYGYHNYFMCGSDVDFAGRKQFYEQHGNHKIFDYFTAVDEGFAADYENAWGICDNHLYEYAKKKITEIAENSVEPFDFTMLTVDTHHEDGFICELCDNTYPEKYANVIACASKQAADFVAWCQNQSWYENTTIVMVGDHLSMAANFWDDIDEYDRRGYNCFINAVENCSVENMHNRDFTTLDYFPTIVASIGGKIEGDCLGLGTNLFSNRKTLSEELGSSVFDDELSLYSKYYNDVFVGDR